ncbi:MULTISPECIES: hypothetical protein [unclassified Leptolyngbya]|uniref:hypothetical protein n=1 Tax=unclassified Leptolyngbya TaxID=2650499 RepID=UPI0016857E74|nr:MULTISPECIES: hypothetical protein [unclassified Leptolyngbya]MBD1909852.1 hypothetical protein [Leptolyngbya sp. FACHB-8]MBD2156948.1 hypothetical protein [Leptolyngbya sp. FACHB-16]
MKQTHTIRFESVREWGDAFLSLFPHRFDYIFAPHANPGETPAWRTESRHPLSDRLIQQGAYLYGVRFGAETNYGLLDIDSGSRYHPKHDPLAISRIAAALEPIGLVHYVACTSSYSGGLHLYFPFQNAQSSWQLAIALACLLENAGFKIQAGQLEIFPNPKPYGVGGNLSLFNAHRLPLQSGSYLLNESWEPIWSDTQTFVNRWKLAQQRNDIDSHALKRIIKQAKRKHFGISGKAEKFINDLNAEIEVGWTGYGQTNRLLGRITMRCYIFHHLLSGGEPLQGDALVAEIVETAQALPGYQEWCRHQHEIEQRAEEWARCIEHSHYFPFGSQSQKPKPEERGPELTAAIDQSPSWNQRQSAATRDRIRRAIADLLEQDKLPAKATARFQALLQYGIGGASLYRHRDLWHPNYLGVEPTQDPAHGDNASGDNASGNTPVENPPNPPALHRDGQLDCAKGAPNCHSSTNLLATGDGDNLQGKGFSDRTSPKSPKNGSDIGDRAPSSQHGIPFIRRVLSQIKATQQSLQETLRSTQKQHRHHQSQQARQQQIARMQQFLNSGDPILVAEALAWAERNPGVLPTDPGHPSLSSLPPEPGNRSALMTAIQSQITRLRWADTRVCDCLHQQFHKDCLTQLSDEELSQWLSWLSSQSE